MNKSEILTQEDLLKKLNNKRVNVLKDNNLKVYEVDPYDLINHRRFDVMAKYIYGKFKENKLASDWGTRLYEEHIWIFNNYDEDDGSGKKGIQSFFKSYNSTLTSMKENGFNDNLSLLPIGKNNEPLDGAHRLSAALLYNKKVKIVKLEDTEVNYNYEFFKQKGLLTKWSDAIAYEYCKLKENTYIVVVFPDLVEQKDKIPEILKRYGSIFYEKTIILKNEGPKNLLNELYKGEAEQINNTNNPFKKINTYFKAQDEISVCVFETCNNENVFCVRKEINELNKLGRDSIYINQSHEETIRLAQLFFNENSIHFLNNAQPGKFEKFKKDLEHYKKGIVGRGEDSECHCVISDAVLAAYGLQDSINFDFINLNLGLNLEHLNRDDPNMHFYKKTNDDIVFNPENHFYYDGIKFASLHVVKLMKKKFGRPRDKSSINIISKFLKDTKANNNSKQLIYSIKKRAKITKLRLIAIKLKFLKKLTGIYNWRN